MNDAGVPCPSAADPARNPHRTGAAWKLRTVAAILANPRYTGRQVWPPAAQPADIAGHAPNVLTRAQAPRTAAIGYGTGQQVTSARRTATPTVTHRDRSQNSRQNSSRWQATSRRKEFPWGLHKIPATIPSAWL